MKNKMELYLLYVGKTATELIAEHGPKEFKRMWTSFDSSKIKAEKDEDISRRKKTGRFFSRSKFDLDVVKIKIQFILDQIKINPNFKVYNYCKKEKINACIVIHLMEKKFISRTGSKQKSFYKILNSDFNLEEEILLAMKNKNERLKKEYYLKKDLD